MGSEVDARSTLYSSHREQRVKCSRCSLVVCTATFDYTDRCCTGTIVYYAVALLLTFGEHLVDDILKLLHHETRTRCVADYAHGSHQTARLLHDCGVPRVHLNTPCEMGGNK